MNDRARPTAMLPLAFALAVLVHAGGPHPAYAQSAEAPQVVRGRFGPDGGTLAVGNVRLVVPAGALRDEQFVALGVGGVPPPAQVAVPTGDTGVLVSSGTPPAAPLTLLVAPSTADLRAASGDPARLALMNTATGEVAGCRAQPLAIACTVAGPGLYLVVGGIGGAALPADLAPPPSGQRPRTPLAVLAGGAAAVLSGVLLLYLLRPLRNSSESNQP